MHEAVRDFYAQHYSANIMKLVLYGRQSLEELESCVRAKFGEVKDKQLQPLTPPGEVAQQLARRRARKSYTLNGMSYVRVGH